MARSAAVSTLLVSLTALPAVLPLLTVDWFESHEAASYPARVVEVRRCWEDGMLSARWFPDLAGGSGYPFLSFYAPGLFWAAGALDQIGFPVSAALKLIVAAAALLAASGAYRLAREGMAEGPAVAAAILYAQAPYCLRDLWTRGDLAEYLALGILPWACWATLRLARRPSPGGAMLAGIVGAGAILAHNVGGLLTGLAMAACAVVALAYAEGGSGESRAAARRRLMLALTFAGATALLLSVFFWLPALMEKKWVQLDNLRRGYFAVERNFLDFGRLLRFLPGPREFQPGRAEPMDFELGPLLLAVPFGIVAWVRRGARVRAVRLLGTALFLGGIFFSLRASAGLYAALPTLRFVGFPWRFLSLVSLGGALLIGAGADAVVGRRGSARRIGEIVVAALLILLAIGATRELRRPLAELRLEPWMLDPAAYREAGFTASVADEYLPIWVQVPERIPFVDGVAVTRPARVTGIERGVARWSFSIEAEAAATVVLEDFFFPDWRASLDGEVVEVRPRPGSGHAEFDVPDGRHEFRGGLVPTRLRRVTAWLSAVMALALGILLAVSRRRKPRYF
jgi:hypothetical protein